MPEVCPGEDAGWVYPVRFAVFNRWSTGIFSSGTCQSFFQKSPACWFSLSSARSFDPLVGPFGIERAKPGCCNGSLAGGVFHDNALKGLVVGCLLGNRPIAAINHAVITKSIPNHSDIRVVKFVTLQPFAVIFVGKGGSFPERT